MTSHSDPERLKQDIVRHLGEALQTLRRWAQETEGWELIPDPIGKAPWAAVHETTFDRTLIVRPADDVDDFTKQIWGLGGLAAPFYQVWSADPLENANLVRFIISME